MKYEMRRAKQRLSPEESLDILNKGSSGVLALWDGEEPYAVPLSYVYHGGKLYFHCARAGRKLEAIRVCPRASFCVVAADDVIPEKYTTAYRSVIVSGPLRILADEAEMVPALHLLAEKYNPETLQYGYNTMPDGEEIYFIPNPALGLWINREKF